jgi:hypothetical protein
MRISCHQKSEAAYRSSGFDGTFPNLLCGMVDLCGNSIIGIEKVEICAMAETESASRPRLSGSTSRASPAEAL